MISLNFAEHQFIYHLPENPSYRVESLTALVFASATTGLSISRYASYACFCNGLFFMTFIIKEMLTKLKKKEEGGLSIEVLPDEIMIEIFTYLEFNDLSNVTSVCKRWNALSIDHTLWRPLLEEYEWQESKPNYPIAFSWIKNIGKVPPKREEIAHFQIPEHHAIDGNQFVSLSHGTVQIWQISSQTASRPFVLKKEQKFEETFTSIACYKEHVYLARPNGHILIWNFSTDKLLEWQKVHDSSIEKIHVNREWIVTRQVLSQKTYQKFEYKIWRREDRLLHYTNFDITFAIPENILGCQYMFALTEEYFCTTECLCNLKNLKKSEEATPWTSNWKLYGVGIATCVYKNLMIRAFKSSEVGTGLDIWDLKTGHRESIFEEKREIYNLRIFNHILLVHFEEGILLFYNLKTRQWLPDSPALASNEKFIGALAGKILISSDDQCFALEFS